MEIEWPEEFWIERKSDGFECSFKYRETRKRKKYIRGSLHEKRLSDAEQLLTEATTLPPLDDNAQYYTEWLNRVLSFLSKQPPDTG